MNNYTSLVMIRHKRRRTRLELSSVRVSDSGEYKCTASNVISRHPASASVQVTVRENVFESGQSPWDRPNSPGDQTKNGVSHSIDSSHASAFPSGLPCPLTTYCLNGATCILLEIINEPSCVCPDGFQGPRCENKLVHLRRLLLDDTNNPQPIESSGMLWQAEEYQVRSLENHPLWRRLQQQKHVGSSQHRR
ncbi:pro-neuregulin-2 [Tropilaelaps mercedesae]|uniref:Pro-neuregulin-2 n=1 Tax=Tropilaelaps mercedesae TaxID=418985 RepID=A0A1V9XSJ2_9ACAR|nr:pro-neuregulin-2 [Tropilaelaps mercedesae]